LGFGASGRSRPLPSFTRSAFASVLSRGLMAGRPCGPSPRRRPSSPCWSRRAPWRARSLYLGCRTVPSPPYDLTVSRRHRRSRSPPPRTTPGLPHAASSRETTARARRTTGREIRTGLARLLECVTEPRRLSRARRSGVGTDVRAASRGARPVSATTVPSASRDHADERSCGRPAGIPDTCGSAVSSRGCDPVAAGLTPRARPSPRGRAMRGDELLGRGVDRVGAVADLDDQAELLAPGPHDRAGRAEAGGDQRSASAASTPGSSPGRRAPRSRTDSAAPARPRPRIRS
jgi:hypothetical protein